MMAEPPPREITELEALKMYVTADTGFANKADGTVLLAVTHSNLSSRFMEIRFDRHMSIMRCKEKLQTHTGTNVSAMRLQLKDWDGNVVADMSDDGKMLGYYSPEDGFVCHVIDLDPGSMSANGWLEDVSKVEKYQMSDEDYNKRDNSYRKFREMKLAQDPAWTIEREMAERRGQEYTPKEIITDEEFMKDEADKVAVGSRCEVSPGGKRGEVMFVGKVKGLPRGYWVGVKFDEPVGKNDGSVKGVRIFECPEGYGSFQRPNNVVVGDFPEEDDPFAEDEDEI